jgi:diguanylate cyclase (GGDEF)-like protein
LSEIVSSAGYPVLTASDGAQALERLAHFPASIVVTDLNMPGIDGLELCRRIRAEAWPGYVFIVLLTSRNDEKDILAGLEAGADEYLGKNTSAAMFLARLRTARRVLALEYSLKDALEKKHHLAMTDPLTGAYNRRYLLRHLGRALKRAQRCGGDVSMMLLDVDYFKRVNDAHGHLAGDETLRSLTQHIVRHLRRETDWCARIGGEEFAVVFEGAALGEAALHAENMRRAIADTPIETSAGIVRITVSIGMSGLEAHADREAATLESLVEMADRNLYISKSAGRNRVTLPRTATGTPHVNTLLPIRSVR